MKRLVENTKWVPIYGVYALLFLFASSGKFMSGGVPDWFIKQFSGTFLNIFPGALGLQFYFIATLEGLAFLIFAIGLGRREFLPEKEKKFLKMGLLLSSFVFLVLEVGLLATHEHDTAFQVFIYLIVTEGILFNL